MPCLNPYEFLLINASPEKCLEELKLTVDSSESEIMWTAEKVVAIAKRCREKFHDAPYESGQHERAVSEAIRMIITDVKRQGYRYRLRSEELGCSIQMAKYVEYLEEELKTHESVMHDFQNRLRKLEEEK